MARCTEKDCQDRGEPIFGIATLFYSLLLTLIGAPTLKAIGMGGNFLQLFLGLNLLAAALHVDSRKCRWFLPAIVVTAIMLKIGSLLSGHEGLSTASFVLWTGIALYAVFSALQVALHSTIITSKHLYAHCQGIRLGDGAAPQCLCLSYW